MTKPLTLHRQDGLTTSEMVVYPMIVVLLIGVAFGFYHNSRIEAAVSAAVKPEWSNKKSLKRILIATVRCRNWKQNLRWMLSFQKASSLAWTTGPGGIKSPLPISNAPAHSEPWSI